MVFCPEGPAGPFFEGTWRDVSSQGWEGMFPRRARVELFLSFSWGLLRSATLLPLPFPPLISQDLEGVAEGAHLKTPQGS